MTLLIIGFAIIQAVLEFFPVSSTGHILILDNLLNSDLNFDNFIILNFGILGALCFFNRQIIGQMIKQFKQHSTNLVLKLIVATLPAIIFGYLLTSIIEDLSTNLFLIALMLIFGGILMIIKPPKSKEITINNLPWAKVLVIGFLQALALIPGVSRLAITTLGGLWQGFNMHLALKWSFLMALPVILGVIIRTLTKESSLIFIEENFLAILIVNLIVFVIGIMVINLAVKMMIKYSLRPFGMYRIGLGILILGFLGLNVL